jgi:short-subunit dehydrogenase
VFNDLLDVEDDRRHPVKKHRPLAAGMVRPMEAVPLLLLLLSSSIIFSLAVLPKKFLAIADLLQSQARDLEIRYGVAATPLFFDATAYALHEEFYAGLDPEPDGVVLAFGYLGDQARAQQDFPEARQIVDYLGAVSILEVVAAHFERRGRGFIIGVSSVAGLRGRQSNYIYGSAKGALAVYLGGLRQRLQKSQVRVITVLPGLVRTKMTEGLDLPEWLVSEPTEVAEDIYQAYKKGRDFIYTRWYWRRIMLIIRLIPEAIFKRLKL